MPKITRRRLLQAGAGAGALALAEAWGLSLTQAQGRPGGRSVSRTTGGARRAVPSTCLMCPARCGILGMVEEGYLVKIEGNPQHPHNQGGLCARGLAGTNQVYNPDRLLYPLRSQGPRGQGRWQRISWEEALEELTGRLRAVLDSGRPHELALVGGLLEGTGGIPGRFLTAFGSPHAYPEMDLYRANQARAHELLWGQREGVPDVAHARYILNFGANPYESDPGFVPLAQRLVQARRQGARLITLDPRLSNTAVKSDEWLPLRVGTDGVVALALAHIILKEGREDRAFLREWTDTTPERLRQHLAPFTPQRAQEESAIPVETLERLAREFVSIRPAGLLIGGGVYQHPHGVENLRAVALLGAVAGIIDAPGGYCLPWQYPVAEPAPPPPQRTVTELLLGLSSGQPRLSLLMTYMANPVYSSPRPSSIQKVLAQEDLVPYFVAVDSFLSETSQLADLVLPAATYLESWGLHSPPGYDLVPLVSLSQPVIPPQGEARAFDEVILELARRLGLSNLDFPNPEAYLRSLVEKVPGLAAAGGLEYLKERGVWQGETEPRYHSYRQNGFATPSGKLELARPALPLPRPGPSVQNGELHLIPFQYNVHTYGRTANAMWLSEIVHRNPVWIHPHTAQERGIKRGDPVRLTSPAGTIIGQAWLTQGIRPEVVGLGACVGHWGLGQIAQAQAFDSRDPNTGLLWWGEHGNGVHVHHLIPFAPDPQGGGPGWNSTLVTLEKV